MSLHKDIVNSSNAPKPLGPYSIANKIGNLVFTSGQIGLNPVTNQLVAGGIEAETRQALTNLKHIVEAAGSSLEMVLKTTVFLRDMSDFPKMNGVYAEFFKDDFPARTTVQAALPLNCAVEIDIIASIP